MPDIFSLVFMADHLHLVAPPGLQRRLGRVAGSFAGRFGVYFHLLDPEPANSWPIVARMMRYGYYNAVRAAMVDDPWSWRWSTLRDLAGATYPVWTPLSTVAEAFGQAPAHVLRTLTTLGDHRPPLPSRSRPHVATVPAIRSATSSALRISLSATMATVQSRRLVVQASDAINPLSARRLGAVLGLGERTIYRLRGTRASGLRAVLACLADPRLLR
jgi:hypothetical protein